MTFSVAQSLINKNRFDAQDMAKRLLNISCCRHFVFQLFFTNYIYEFCIGLLMNFMPIQGEVMAAV
jgi:hypothetical protein